MKYKQMECNVDGYTLRIEKMNEYVWHWNVSLGGAVIESNGIYGKHAKSSKEAKALAECAQIRHSMNKTFEWIKV